MAIVDLPYQIQDVLNILDLEKLTVFKFAVEMDGMPGSRFFMGFNKVTGLSDSIEVREIPEGGYKGRYKFPRKSRTTPLVLSRGMTFNRELWRWYEETRSWTKGNPDYRKTLSVYILDSVAPLGQMVNYEVWRFDIFNAWPSEWTGPELSANDEETAIESVTLQHSGISSAKSLISDKVANVISILQ